MRLLSIAALAVLVAALPARAAVNVVTTTEDLADLTRQVGGDRVKVESIARGYQDPHFVEAKPSFILKLAKADLLVVRTHGRTGLDAFWSGSLTPRLYTHTHLPMLLVPVDEK
jgi:zinc/manganese transport system substrate-binding protein